MKFRWRSFVLLLSACAVVVLGLQFNVDHYARAQGVAAIADVTSFSGALAWVKSAGYFVMFLAMVIEGPVITAAAAFASALGYFNIFIVLILSILGDLVGDFVYYAIGYFGREAVVEKYGSKFGLSKQRMEKMERLIEEHPKKTLTAIKLAPMLPAPGLMMIGATRMPIGKYTWMTLAVTLPKTIFFMVLGYYFGSAYNAISPSFQNGEYFIVVALVVIVAAFYAYKKLAAVFSVRLEKI